MGGSLLWVSWYKAAVENQSYFCTFFSCGFVLINYVFASLQDYSYDFFIEILPLRSSQCNGRPVTKNEREKLCSTGCELWPRPHLLPWTFWRAIFLNLLVYATHLGFSLWVLFSPLEGLFHRICAWWGSVLKSSWSLPLTSTPSK